MKRSHSATAQRKRENARVERLRREEAILAKYAAPIADVPSGVHVVRDAQGIQFEILVPFFIASQVGRPRPMLARKVFEGLDAVDVVARSTAVYVDVLQQLLGESRSSKPQERHARMLLLALSSLECAAPAESEMTGFAVVGQTAVGTAGRRSLSVHHAAVRLLSWVVNWGLDSLKALQTSTESHPDFFTRLVSEETPVLGSLLDGPPDPRALLDDWANADVLMTKEWEQARAGRRTAPRRQPSPIRDLVLSLIAEHPKSSNTVIARLLLEKHGEHRDQSAVGKIRRGKL